MINTKLNDVQLHLLKMFSIPFEEKVLIDVKKLLSDYFFQKVTSFADSEWEKRGYSNELMKKWIYEEAQ
jgi:hypothetical protein